eukprot:scaffold321996_cov33-Tisochrysis_lutea.AAC.4
MVRLSVLAVIAVVASGAALLRAGAGDEHGRGGEAPKFHVRGMITRPSRPAAQHVAPQASSGR